MPATVAEIVAVRHGESVANVAFAAADAADVPVPFIAARDGDVPLSARGRGQSAALRTALAEHFGPAGPDLVLCSPYLRARETARIALGGDASRSHVDERLRDRETGILELLNEAAVRERHPDEHVRRGRVGEHVYRPPGGESLQDVALRVRSLLADLGWSGIPLSPSGPIGGRALIIAHDAVVSMLGHVVDGRPGPRVANASLSVWAVRDGRLRTAVHNRTSHLRKEESP